MPVEARVTGSDDFNRLATKLRKAASEWDRELDRGLQDAGEVVADAIRSGSDPYLPAGYEKVFAASMVTKVSLVRGAVRRAVVNVRAFGRRGHDRQVEKLEQGLLKHKFWGRWVNSPKAWQKIRAGLVSGPARNASPAAAKKIAAAVRRVTNKI